MGKKVTVVGAGFYGSTTAQRLAEYDVFETVVLTDIVEGKPEGLALDLNQSRADRGLRDQGRRRHHRPERRGLRGHRGLRRRRHHRRPAAQARHEPDGPARASTPRSSVRSPRTSPSTRPNAVVIVVSNPLDEMTALAQIATEFPKHRVLGQAGMLDTARFTNFVAEALSVPVAHGQDADAGLARRHDGAGPVAAARSTASRWPTCSRPTRSRSWSPAPATAAPRSWRCSRPARPTTPRRPPRPAWPRPSPRTPARSCRSAPGSTASTASPASTWASRPRSAPTGVRKVVETDLADTELAGLKEAAEAVRAKQADVGRALTSASQAGAFRSRLFLYGSTAVPKCDTANHESRASAVASAA